MLEKLKDILTENIGNNGIEITEDTVLISDLGLNSLDLVNLSVSVEDEFDIEIPDRAIKDFKTVGDVIEFIEKQYPENMILQKEQLHQLDQLLHQLDKTEYFILLLRYVNELSYDEISEVLEIPLNEVRNKLHRSKRKLRQLATTKGGYFHEMQ